MYHVKQYTKPTDWKVEILKQTMFRRKKRISYSKEYKAQVLYIIIVFIQDEDNIFYKIETRIE